MSSAICFILDQSKILSSANGLRLKVYGNSGMDSLLALECGPLRSIYIFREAECAKV